MIGKTEGFFWAVIGAFICLLAWKTHLGSFREPGPGFVAFLSGLFIAGVGLIMILTETREKLSPGEPSHLSFSVGSWLQLTFTMALLSGYAILLDILGYGLTTFLVMWGFFYAFGGRRWAFSLMVSLIIVVVTYLVFEVWLRCQFPRGIFL